MTDKDAVKCEQLCAGGQFWRIPLEVTLDPGLVPAVIDRI
jgi:tetraacyldisaccharide-1-P 4'-kinase